MALPNAAMLIANLNSSMLSDLRSSIDLIDEPICIQVRIHQCIFIINYDWYDLFNKIPDVWSQNVIFFALATIYHKCSRKSKSVLKCYNFSIIPLIYILHMIINC